MVNRDGKGSRYSFQSDVFSFGVVMYEVLQRKKPWDGYTPIDAAMRVIDGDRLETSKGVPLIVQDIMSSCFEADPQKRNSMKLIFEKLTDLLNDTDSFKDVDQQQQEKKSGKPKRSSSSSKSKLKLKVKKSKEEMEKEKVKIEDMILKHVSSGEFLSGKLSTRLIELTSMEVEQRQDGNKKKNKTMTLDVVYWACDNIVRPLTNAHDISVVCFSIVDNIVSMVKRVQANKARCTVLVERVKTVVPVLNILKNDMNNKVAKMVAKQVQFASLVQNSKRGDDDFTDEIERRKGQLEILQNDVMGLLSALERVQTAVKNTNEIVKRCSGDGKEEEDDMKKKKKKQKVSKAVKSCFVYVGKMLTSKIDEEEFDSIIGDFEAAFTDLRSCIAALTLLKVDDILEKLGKTEDKTTLKLEAVLAKMEAATKRDRANLLIDIRLMMDINNEKTKEFIAQQLRQFQASICDEFIVGFEQMVGELGGIMKAGFDEVKQDVREVKALLHGLKNTTTLEHGGKHKSEAVTLDGLEAALLYDRLQHACIAKGKEGKRVFGSIEGKSQNLEKLFIERFYQEKEGEKAAKQIPTSGLLTMMNTGEYSKDNYCKHILIEGDAGCGKTTLLRYLVRKQNKEKGWEDAEMVVFVSLPGLQSDMKGKKEKVTIGSILCSLPGLDEGEENRVSDSFHCDSAWNT